MSSKRSERRPNGNVSKMTASGATASKVASSRSRRVVPIRVVDGNVIGVAQRHEARVRDPDRRQLHDVHAARHAPADRHAAAHEMHVEARVGQRLGDEAGAHQVADAQQMLDVDHDDWHGRAPEGGSME